jgi:hypothetical protein
MSDRSPPDEIRAAGAPREATSVAGTSALRRPPMADRGIIFSAQMVRALLDGRKTQTRRLCAWANNPASPALTYIVACDQPGCFGDEEGEVQFQTFCAPGDRLYVREAWQVRGVYSDIVEVGYRASENRSHTDYVEQIPVANALPGKGKWPSFPNYGPSIHMPRWASRLWLAVTEVRVQRLQDCSKADAVAEGIEARGVGTLWGWIDYQEENPHITRHYADPRESYRSLWDSLHLDEGATWAANPWVVAVSFDVHRGRIDQVTA